MKPSKRLYKDLLARLETEGKGKRYVDGVHRVCSGDALKKWEEESRESKRFVAVASGGTESLVVEELRDVLAPSKEDKLHILVLTNEDVPMTGKIGLSLILFSTIKSWTELSKLKSPRRILAYLGAHVADVGNTSASLVSPTLPKEVVLARLRRFMDESFRWDEAKRLWCDCRADVVVRTDDAPSFRASVVRGGDKLHRFKSRDVAPLLGEIALKHLPRWTVDLIHFDVEIIGMVFEGSFVAGIGTDDPSSTRRDELNSKSNALDGFVRGGNDIRPWRHCPLPGKTACLRASTAYALLRLARLQPGDVVLDCMCGVGSIPIEAAHVADPRIFGLGGELDADACMMAGRNIKSYEKLPSHVHGAVEVCRWDASCLPLRSSSVDVSCVDLPFGVRCGHASRWRVMYPKILIEIARVTRVGGRAVLMSALKKILLLSVIASKALWQIHSVRSVNIGGIITAVVVLLRQKPPRIKGSP